MYGVQDDVLDVLGPLCDFHDNVLATERQQAVLAPEDILQTIQVYGLIREYSCKVAANHMRE